MIANAATFAQVRGQRVWARDNTPSADALRGMTVGDILVPLFEATPYHGEASENEFRAAAHHVGQGTEELEEAYRGLLSTSGAVPFILTVRSAARTATVDGAEVVEVGVDTQALGTPLSGDDFLRLRALEANVAAQLKGTTPLLRIIEVAPGLAKAVRDATDPARETDALLKRYSLVDASTEADAIAKLTAAGRTPLVGDQAFIINRTAIPGLAFSSSAGKLTLTPQKIARSPEAVRDLLIDAQRRTNAGDQFDAEPGIKAVELAIGLIQDGKSVRVIDDFRVFYEFSVLANLVTKALTIQKRPLPADVPTATEGPTEGELAEDLAAINSNLAGLTVEAVQEQLPEGFSVPRSVLAAAVTALRAGKHLLLGGPPGTGKTTLAEALCRAVVATNFHVATATADWTTFDTIGGYLPDGESGLTFSAGVVLRSLRTAGWLVIDEVNRADIDKAFGPLFTVLSGSDSAAGRTSVLPYSTEDGPVVIKWAETLDDKSATYTITPSWRLIGTLNVADKASLFRLSFAFLRRFAVIDIPLPEPDQYRALFERWLGPGDFADASGLLKGLMAVIGGPVEIGPAIGHDMADFVIQGIAPTASGTPAFGTPEEALAVAIRLFVAPQYEGQAVEMGDKLIDRLKATTSLTAEAIEGIRSALKQVALT